MTEDSIQRARELFPITRERVYMNHAAIGPLPQTAVERATAVAQSVADSADEHWDDRLAEAERVRGLAARLMGAQQEHEVAFVGNTSEGLSIVSAGLDWQPGDNVVGADCEFPSNVYPWLRLSKQGVEYRQAAELNGRLDTESVLSQIDGRTRVVALSWVQFASGFKSDLRTIGEYCRERDVIFVVDGIQALGALDIDVVRDNVDVLAADAHKWLLGPEGIGVTYVSDRVIDRLEPIRVGWTSVKSWINWTRYELNYRDGAGRFEPGTLNMLGIYALGASLELLLEHGTPEIEERIHGLTDRLATGLAERHFHVVSSRAEGEWSGVVAVTHPTSEPKDIVASLGRAGVDVAHRAGRVRIAPHFYNTEEEVDRLLQVLAQRHEEA